MSFDLLRKKKTAEILVALLKKESTCGIREIQEMVEGSYTTIIKRIKELVIAGLVEEVKLTGEESGRAPYNKRLLRLTDEGRRLSLSLVESAFLKVPSFSKARDRWVLSLLYNLKKVTGRTRFMKLLFLLKYEFGLGRRSFFKFRSGIFGPISRGVSEDLEELKSAALITEKRVSLSKDKFEEDIFTFEYTLSSEGQNIALDLISNLSDSEIQSLRKLRSFNEMTLTDLLAYIYQKYPKYITGSEIVESSQNHQL